MVEVQYQALNLYDGIEEDIIMNFIIFQGKPIHPNIRLFSICYPYRFRAQIRPLPEQILDYIWDYGILKPKDEYKYIQIMIKNELKELAQPVFAELLFASQKFIRKVEETWEKTFTRIIREEQDDYINRMQIPSDIVKNEALLENILAMIVCILTKIPIFVIGETGSSKSLAVRYISSNLCGSESKDDYFKSLPKVHIVPYLCSPSSTSDGISKIFEKANKYQETSSDQFPVINVVLLDNVGSAESHSSNSLNRALLVQRLRFDLEDLVDISEYLLNIKIIEPSQMSIIENLAKAYLDYKQHDQALPNFYGLRDYYSLIEKLSFSELTLPNTQMIIA
ncbi:hypothetical protein C1645_838790, partial [Glomus cerebriforme]